MRDSSCPRPYCSRLVALVATILCAIALGSCALLDRSTSGGSVERIQNVVVIYAENHSFDNLFGLFPGANGIANATAEQRTQLDHDGTPLKELTIWSRNGKADSRFVKLPNGPFRIDAPPISMAKDKLVPSPTHAFYHDIEQNEPGLGRSVGTGSRVPAILGPMVKKGYIDSTSYDTTSIIKFITRRFDLEPLPGVRARAGDLTNALQ